MKKSLIITVLMALAMSGLAQEIHFDFSAYSSTGYEIYYRITNAENHWIEATYPCQNGDNYWWGYDKPEGKLILSETVNHNGTDYTLVAIGDHAFSNCTGLRGVLELPQTITAIGEGAFKNCSNLNGDLNIPDFVTRIESEAFEGCAKLSGELHLSDSLTYIGNRAFFQCSSLTGQIAIPRKVTSIGDSAFEECTGFNNVVYLPEGLQSIGEHAFKGDSNIKQFRIKCSEPPVTAENAMEGVPNWISIFVPYNTKDVYQNATGWSRFGNSIVERSFWDGTATPWTKGNGTADSPYLIESAENLAWLAQNVNERFDLQYDVITWYTIDGFLVIDTVYYVNDVKAYQDTCFKLVIDLDLQRYSNLTWTPIGSKHISEYNDYSTFFSGSFDGEGYTIANYLYQLLWSYDPTEIKDFGVFGLVSDAVIKNVTVSGARINSHQENTNCGGIVGSGYNSTLLNCQNLSGVIDCGHNSPVEGSSIGGIIGYAHSCRIEDCTNSIHLTGARENFVGGIVGTFGCGDSTNFEQGIFNCCNLGLINFYNETKTGGIVGRCWNEDQTGTVRIEHCYSKSTIKGLSISANFGHDKNKVGGLVGYVSAIDSLIIMNCYSNDSLLTHATTTSNYVGGLVGPAETATTLYIKNCYHAGNIVGYHKGGIISNNTDATILRNCYFDQSVAPDDGFGVPLENDYMKSAAFVNQLNNGSTVFQMDTEPYENDGYPVFGTDGLIFVGAEWYYEILNENGSITYQHLECVGDTLFEGGKRPKIIIRSNTQYDKDLHTEVTHEYVYEENGVVYWWNKELQIFTVLYDFSAEESDQWEIHVGSENILVRVYEIENQMIDGIPYKKMTIGDTDNLFSGTLISTIGHMTSFFPERLMTRGKGYRVDGLRCYWVEDELVFQQGNENCDAIHVELHNGVGEDGPSTGSGTLTVYPNPANSVLFVRLPQCDSPTADKTEYRITNLMGQALLSGRIDAENQQIDISALPAGMYFISVGEQTVKFVVE